MTGEMAIQIIKEDALYNKEAAEMAITAIKLMNHIKDRPCDVCEFHDEEGCHKWDCVFDEWLHAYVYRKGQQG